MATPEVVLKFPPYEFRQGFTLFSWSCGKYLIVFLNDLIEKALFGLIIKRLVNHVESIVAVEKFEEFSSFIAKNPRIKVVTADIIEYEPQDTFNLITLFGVAHHFNKQEISQIYDRAHGWLDEGGQLIVKNQFGIKEDVIVDGFSQELNKEYDVSYRCLDTEVRLLKGAKFKNIRVMIFIPQRKINGIILITMHWCAPNNHLNVAMSIFSFRCPYPYRVLEQKRSNALKNHGVETLQKVFQFSTRKDNDNQGQKQALYDLGMGSNDIHHREKRVYTTHPVPSIHSRKLGLFAFLNYHLTGKIQC